MRRIETQSAKVTVVASPFTGERPPEAVVEETVDTISALLNTANGEESALLTSTITITITREWDDS